MKNAVLLSENAPHSWRAEDAKRLELADVEQAHDAIYVGAGKEDGGHGRGGFRRRGCQFGRSKELLAKIRRGIQEEPRGWVRRDGSLRLRTRTTL